MRFLLLSLAILIGTNACCQTRPQAIQQIMGIADDVMNYINNIKDSPTQADIDHLNDRFKLAVSVWSEPSLYGDLIDKKVMTYYSTIIYYRMGHMFYSMKRFDEAYNYYKHLPPAMTYLVGEASYPMKFDIENFSYTLNYSYFINNAPLFYNDMLAILVTLEKWQEVEKIANTAIELKNNTAYRVYLASTFMIEAAQKRKISNDSLLDYYLMNIKHIAALDTADKRFIKENQLPSHESRYVDVEIVLPTLNHKADAYIKTARTYLEVRDMKRAKDFFMVIMNEGYWDEFVLKDAGDMAVESGDIAFGLKIVAAIKAFPHPENNCIAYQTAAKISEAFGPKSDAKYFRRQFEKCEKRLYKRRK